MPIIDHYKKIGVVPKKFELELEGKEYEACRFEIQGKKNLGRTAKLTPKKSGLFVTLWKRNGKGITAPFDELDPIDFVIILVTEDDKSGYFKFSKSTLIQKGIMSTTTKDGKRGFRVYPPWTNTTSKQAEKTQKWQITHFNQI
jgi:hypothetical protein